MQRHGLYSQVRIVCKMFEDMHFSLPCLYIALVRFCNEKSPAKLGVLEEKSNVKIEYHPAVI